MTFRDRARDPIGLFIAVLIGLLFGVVLVVGGDVPIVVAILAGAGLTVVLFGLSMAFGRTAEREKLDAPRPPASPVPPAPVGPAVSADSAGPAGRAVAMLRRSADGYADIVAASIAVRDPANAREVSLLVTVAREVVDLVGEYTAMVAEDERRGIEPDDGTEDAVRLLERGEHWLMSAAATLNQGRYSVLDDHVQSLRATRTALGEGVHQHAESRKGTAGG